MDFFLGVQLHFTIDQKVFSGRFPKTEGPRPLRLPWGSRFAVRYKEGVLMRFVSALVFYFRQCRFEAFSQNLGAEQQIFGLEPAKSKFPLEISLHRGFGGAGESSSHRRGPLTRTFAEQKCLVTAKDRRFAARQKDRCKRIKIERNHKTERECPRNRKHSLILFAQIVENSMDSKRAAALLSPARQREKSNFFAAARHRASLRS